LYARAQKRDAEARQAKGLEYVTSAQSPDTIGAHELRLRLTNVVGLDLNEHPCPLTAVVDDD
jgi:hypothetical protein